jgi:hypothetical protein
VQIARPLLAQGGRQAGGNAGRLRPLFLYDCFGLGGSHGLLFWHFRLIRRLRFDLLELILQGGLIGLGQGGLIGLDGDWLVGGGFDCGRLDGWLD